MARGGSGDQQLQSRLVAAIDKIQENVEADAQRFGRLVARVLLALLVLILIAGVVLLFTPVLSAWSWLEPVAWLVGIVLALLVPLFNVKVPKISPFVEERTTRWRLRRRFRLIDLDAIRATIQGDR